MLSAALFPKETTICFTNNSPWVPEGTKSIFSGRRSAGSIGFESWIDIDLKISGYTIIMNIKTFSNLSHTGYNFPHILEEESWNNAFSYDERKGILGKKPHLFIPSLIKWNIENVETGEEIVFEEIESWKLKSCKWLKHFIRLKESPIPITIFDNHNHALYFWLEALHEWRLEPGFELIHIDEHSDLWPNNHTLEIEKAKNDLQYAWEFTNFYCNVWNYIEPSRECGLIWNMIRIENEFQIDEFMNHVPNKNSVLNIDLDFFAPEMDFIDEKKKITLIQNLIWKVGCITIATSPFFIEQRRAIWALGKIFQA